MFSLFSFSESTSIPNQSLDLQLLSDDELLSIWEQTQLAEIMLLIREYPLKILMDMPKQLRQKFKLVLFKIKIHLFGMPSQIKTHTKIILSNNDFDFF